MLSVIPGEEVDVIVARLRRYERRFQNALYTAVGVRRIWATLNDDNPYRLAISGSAASAAVAVMMNSLQRELIIILVRLLDNPRGDVLQSDKISFPVIGRLFEMPGVEEALVRDARGWVGGSNPERHEQAAAEALRSFHARLNRLREEDPNRAQLLRNFRDENLAHELHFDEVRERPLHRHLGEILDELIELANDAALAISGNVVAWEFLHEDVENSATELWRLINAGIEASEAEQD